MRQNLVIVEKAQPDPSPLRKAREVIYTYPRRGKITLIMRRAFNRMVENAHKTGIEQEWYRIQTKDLAKNIEYGSRDMTLLHETLDKMQTTLIKWREIDASGKTRDTSVQLVGKVHIDGNIRPDGKHIQREIHYRFDKEVKDKLFHSPSVALIDLNLQNRFRSAHTAALYELIMHVIAEGQPDNEGWIHSPRYRWQNWRDLIMGGDSTDYYENFKYFKRDVLSKTLSELNRVIRTHEVVAVTYLRGKTIEDLEFRVRAQPQAELQLDDVSNDEPIIDTKQIEDDLSKFGFNEIDISEILESSDPESIKTAIDYTRARLVKPGVEPLTRVDAYFLKALAGNYGGTEKERNSVSSRLKRARLEAQQGGKKPASKPEAERGAPARLPPPDLIDAKAAATQMANGRAYYQTLAPSVQQQLRDEWLKFEAKPPERAAFQKSGLKSMMVQSSFYVYLSRNAEVR